MFDYKFYIGCNDKDTKEDNSAIIMSRALVYFNDNFDAFSYSVVNGVYTHNDNTVITEKTCIIELLLDNELVDIELITATLKELCNQESILVTVSKVQGGLY